MNFKDYCIKEGIVGAVAGLAWDAVKGVGAALLADIFRDSPILAAGILYGYSSVSNRAKQAFKKDKNGKVVLNPEAFEKLEKETQKEVLDALKKGMDKIKQKNPQEYKKAAADAMSQIDRVGDPKAKQKLQDIFSQIFTESDMKSFKEFMGDANAQKQKAQKQKAADLKAKAADINAEAEEAEAEVAKDVAVKAKNNAQYTNSMEEAATYGSKDKKKTSGKDVAGVKRDKNGVRIPTKHASVYAGANGKSKPIPYTQDPEMKNQAVGPNVDEEEDGDDIDDANPKPEEKEIAPVYSAQGLGESEDPTINQGYDAMYDSFIRDMNSGKSDWQKMEESLKAQSMNESCGPAGCSLGVPTAGGSGMVNSGMMSVPGIGSGINGVQPRIPAVVDKSEIYKFIKDQSLHQGNREQAMSFLLSKFGANPTEELEMVLDDAIMSSDPQQIEMMDRKYNYQDVLNFERPDTELPSFLSQAWQTMENSDDLKDL